MRAVQTVDNSSFLITQVQAFQLAMECIDMVHNTYRTVEERFKSLTIFKDSNGESLFSPYQTATISAKLAWFTHQDRLYERDLLLLISH